MDQPRDAVGKGEVFVDAQSPDPRVIVKKGLPDTAALQGAEDLEAVFAQRAPRRVLVRIGGAGGQIHAEVGGVVLAPAEQPDLFP